MQLTQLIIILAVVAFILLLIIFPNSRALFKALINHFISDAMETPEGAESMFEQKIDEAKDSYDIASDAYNKSSGERKQSEDTLARLQKQQIKVEQEIESLVKANDIESAELKTEQREEIISDIENEKKLLIAYKRAEVTAKDAFEKCQQNVRNLEKEKRETVKEMKINQQLKKVYDDIDELKSNTSTDRMLDKVRENRKELNVYVDGAKEVHDNKLSTKLENADAKAKQVSSNDYLEDIKKKYNK